MKKSQLNTGMFIIFDDGSIGMVLLGTTELGGDFVVFDRDNYSSFQLNRFPSDVINWKYNYASVLRISKPIYKKYYGRKFTDIPKGNVEVIWERPEKKHTVLLTLDGKGIEREVSDETFNILKGMLEELK